MVMRIITPSHRFFDDDSESSSGIGTGFCGGSDMWSADNLLQITAKTARSMV
jgi:hypothetical protein